MDVCGRGDKENGSLIGVPGSVVVPCEVEAVAQERPRIGVLGGECFCHGGCMQWDGVTVLNRAHLYCKVACMSKPVKFVLC